MDGFVANDAGIPAIALTTGSYRASHTATRSSSRAATPWSWAATRSCPPSGPADWPWPGLQVYVLTTRPLPDGTPADVIAAPDPAALAEALRSRPSGGDLHLVGGPRTIRAFSAIGALDRLEVVLLPVLIGTGVLLPPAGAPALPLRLLRADRIFPDGSAELVYTPGS